jgi:omega-3 fatty acid desaturase (delta-15 desaturase)
MNTGNMDMEEVFHPVRQSDWTTKGPGDRAAKTGSYFALGFGWFLYLAMGYSARENRPQPEIKSHYSLNNPLFAQHQTGVAWSLWCWRVWMLLLGYGVYRFGWVNMTLYYFVPIFVYATWLTVVTFLHHHEPEAHLPWFGDAAWNYVKGNVSSIDRSYGCV